MENRVHEACLVHSRGSFGRRSCVVMAKAEILSIPDGTHHGKLSRSCGDGVPGGRARTVYRVPEETAKPVNPRYRGTDVQHRVTQSVG